MRRFALRRVTSSMTGVVADRLGTRSTSIARSFTVRRIDSANGSTRRSCGPGRRPASDGPPDWSRLGRCRNRGTRRCPFSLHRGSRRRQLRSQGSKSRPRSPGPVSHDDPDTARDRNRRHHLAPIHGLAVNLVAVSVAPTASRVCKSRETRESRQP